MTTEKIQGKGGIKDTTSKCMRKLNKMTAYAIFRWDAKRNSTIILFQTLRKKKVVCHQVSPRKKVILWSIMTKFQKKPPPKT